MYSLFSVAESFLVPIQSPSKIPNHPPKDNTGHDNETKAKIREILFELSFDLSLPAVPVPNPTLEACPASPNSKSHSSQHSHPKIISFFYILMLAHKSDSALCSEISFFSCPTFTCTFKKPTFAMVKWPSDPIPHPKGEHTQEIWLAFQRGCTALPELWGCFSPVWFSVHDRAVKPEQGPSLSVHWGAVLWHR